MASEPLFAGLVVDEYDRPVGVGQVGGEPCYIVDDNGFRLHIASEQVDRQVLQHMRRLIEGHEDILAQQAAQMLGADDPFSLAAIQQQFQNLDQQFEQLLQIGLPEEVRAYLGMVGFRVRINIHGEVLEINLPGYPGEEE
ncbi:MAG TPA: hypothetical protein G4O04_00165 [Anaerolineae bacterium]|nr:hypothetical protein [Anaerolineae bacterium]HID84098.1 hypothetical protein [Anaerolineales bacterium]HIQ08490.1 hypothetical protein [Anaerolineaceae bacterium]